MAIFNDRLKELIDEGGAGLSEISRNSDISKACLSFWTRFDITPSLRNIIKVALYFNVSIDYLLGRSDNSDITLSGKQADFKNRLLSIIKEKSLTQYRVCKDIHIDTAQMTDWVKNGALPSADNIILLADYFNISTDFLIGISDLK